MRARPFVGFLFRHFLAVPIFVTILCVAWMALFFILLAFATDSSPGGIFALATGLVFITLAIVVIGWGIFAPACGIGLLLCHHLRWPRIYAIPLAWVASLLLAYGQYWLFAYVFSIPSMPLGFKVLTPSVLILSLLLGIYWCLAETFLPRCFPNS